MNWYGTSHRRTYFGSSKVLCHVVLHYGYPYSSIFSLFQRYMSYVYFIFDSDLKIWIQDKYFL